MEMLRQLRIENGLTQEQLAKEIGVSDATINMYEKGLRKPKYDKILKMAVALKIESRILIADAYGVSADNNKAIGMRIKNIRLKLGMTTEKFAQAFQEQPPSKGTISKWENGHYLPNNERLKRIAELGGTTVEELLEDEENVTISNSEYKYLKEIEEKYNVIKTLVTD